MTDWINVKDKLPPLQKITYCIVYCYGEGVVARPFNGFHNCWDLEDGDDYFCNPIGGKITHWQLSPEKPKDI